MEWPALSTAIEDTGWQLGRMGRLQGVTIEPKPESTSTDVPPADPVSTSDMVSGLPLPGTCASSVGLASPPVLHSSRGLPHFPHQFLPGVPFGVASPSPAVSAGFVAMHARMHAGTQADVLGQSGFQSCGCYAPPSFGSPQEPVRPPMCQPSLSQAPWVQQSQFSPSPQPQAVFNPPPPSSHLPPHIPPPSAPRQQSQGPTCRAPPFPLPHLGAHGDSAASSQQPQPWSPFPPPYNSPFDPSSPAGPFSHPAESRAKPTRLRTPAELLEAVGGLKGETLTNVQSGWLSYWPHRWIGTGQETTLRRTT